MKRKGFKVIALVLAMMLVLTACGGGQGGTANKGGKGLENLYTWETSNRELEGWFVQNSEKAADLNVLTNCYAALLSQDGKGQLIADAATEWGSEDGGKTWTFKLRDDIVWVDYQGNEKGKVTAQDWITGLEWVLNYHKTGPNNTSMPFAIIAGAEDYYNYTESLTYEEAMSMDNSKFLEMVGIAAPDDYTLVYTCPTNCSYFPTLTTAACLYPLAQGLVDEMGNDAEAMVGITYDKLWYSGPYTVTEFILNNTKTLTKNPKYYDKDATLFETVNIKIIEDTTVGYQLFENGEIDHIDLSEANLRTIYEDENHKYHNYLSEKLPRKYSYQMHLNYDKHLEDGSADVNWNTAVANENFRLSLYYGLNLYNYWSRTNFINPTNCENLAYTMKGLDYFSDGTEYTAKVIETLGIADGDGTSSRRYDEAKALEYKEKAMAELEAKGVTFPIEIDYFISAGSQNALDTATVLEEIFEGGLGSDYVDLQINTYVSSQTQEVINPRLQSFAINGWGADYGDIYNFLGQETYGEDSAYYSMNYSNANDNTDPDLVATYKEFTELVNKAAAITDDHDARLQAFCDAEVYMLQHALAIPVQYEVSWQLTKVNDYTKSNALYGINNYLYKNWQTSVDPYTTEQIEAFKAEYNK